MAQRLFNAFPGRSRLLCDWLRLRGDRHADDPSLHDLLELDESCFDRALIRAKVIQQTRKLRALEASVHSQGDPAESRFLNALQAYISSAERILCENREQYEAELQEYRVRMLRRTLRDHFEPHSGLPDGERATLVSRLSPRLRIPERIAKQIVDEYFEPDARPEGSSAQLVKWLSIPPFPDDPVWPTHFDMLGLKEGQSATANMIRKKCAEQIAKIAKFERHPNPDKSRDAKLVRKKLEAAAEVLSDPVESRHHLERCVNARTRKLRSLVKEHIRLKTRLEEGDRLLLHRRGLRLRLESAAIGEVLAQFAFPEPASTRTPSKKNPTRPAAPAKPQEIPHQADSERKGQESRSVQSGLSLSASLSYCLGSISVLSLVLGAVAPVLLFSFCWTALVLGIALAIRQREWYFARWGMAFFLIPTALGSMAQGLSGSIHRSREDSDGDEGPGPRPARPSENRFGGATSPVKYPSASAVSALSTEPLFGSNAGSCHTRVRT